MSIVENQDNEIVISAGYPEKIPGNPESYRKMANEFEDVFFPWPTARFPDIQYT